MSSSSSESDWKMPGKRRRQSTIPMVNQEANAILEEFLKMHQKSLNSITPMSSVYQKVSELNVFEEKPNYKRRSSYVKASQESILSNQSFQSLTKTEYTVENMSAPLASDEGGSSDIESPSSAPDYLCGALKRHSSSNSSTTSSETDSRVRHKKSLFKRAKERLRVSFNITKKQKKVKAERTLVDGDDDEFIKKKKKKKKRKNKKEQILNEVTTCTRTHIRQSSTISDIPCQKTEIILREGDIWESKKIKDKNGDSRNIKSHLNIKESSDTSGKKGLQSSFKKIKELHRNSRKSLSLGRKEGAECQKIVSRRRTSSDCGDKPILVIKEESKDSQDSTTTNVLNSVLALTPDVATQSTLIETSAGRNHLHLNLNPVFTSELPDRGNFEFKAEHVEKVTTVLTPTGQRTRRSSIEHHEHLNDCDDSETVDAPDEVDGAVYGAMASLTSSSHQTNNEMVKRAAGILLNLADTQTSTSDSESACAPAISMMGSSQPLNQLEAELVERLLSIKTTSEFPREAVFDLVKQLTYNNFKDVFQKYSKEKSGIQEVAALFYLSKAAIQFIGPCRAMASQIKELTLKYFEDKCAAFIVEKGGWDSVIEDTDEEPKGE
ncbi:uncharacterized protein LOC115232331 isoform X1 [Argonauta hians]